MGFESMPGKSSRSREVISQEVDKLKVELQGKIKELEDIEARLNGATTNPDGTVTGIEGENLNNEKEMANNLGREIGKLNEKIRENMAEYSKAGL